MRLEEASQSCVVGIALLVTSLVNYAAIFTGILFMVASATGSTGTGLVVGLLGAVLIMSLLLSIPITGPLIASGFGVYAALTLWEWPLAPVLLLFLWWPATLLIAFLHDLYQYYF